MLRVRIFLSSMLLSFFYTSSVVASESSDEFSSPLSPFPSPSKFLFSSEQESPHAPSISPVSLTKDPVVVQEDDSTTSAATVKLPPYLPPPPASSDTSPSPVVSPLLQEDTLASRWIRLIEERCQLKVDICRCRNWTLKVSSSPIPPLTPEQLVTSLMQKLSRRSIQKNIDELEVKNTLLEAKRNKLVAAAKQGPSPMGGKKTSEGSTSFQEIHF